MTAFNYARPLATANRLIKRYGRSGKVRRFGAATGAAHNPTPGAAVDHDAFFAVLNYENSEIDGTRVLRDDRFVLLSVGTLSIVPALSDKLVQGDGTVYSIVKVDPVGPGDTTLLYEIQARR